MVDGRGVSAGKSRSIAHEVAQMPFRGLECVGSARARVIASLSAMPLDPFGTGPNADSLTSFSIHYWPGGSGGLLLYPAFTFDSSNLRCTQMLSTFTLKAAVRPVGGTWFDLDEYRPAPEMGFFEVPFPYMEAGNIEVASFVDGATGLIIPSCWTARTSVSETVFYGRIDTANTGCTTTSIVLNGAAAQTNHYVG
ncbi:MAG: hypothetical protein EOP06_31625, partial [Proteobacteria bacterium]